MQKNIRNQFLPMTKKELEMLGINELDFVYVSGDAYVDHPSFGHAVITRVLQAHGYQVGIIAQPDWKDEESIAVLGRPRLAFLVSAGNMDSMVNHYTVAKKKRSNDAYTPGGKAGKRPDHAAVVYSNLIRRKFKDVPIILGGIEASLRRMAHYDYWSDKMKRSILLDSGADLISYGMGERSILEIAEMLNSGVDISNVNQIRGTVYKTKMPEIAGKNTVYLPKYEQLLEDSTNYAKSFYVQYMNTDAYSSKTLVEEYPHQVYVVQNPPAYPLSEDEMDEIYGLPYTRNYHPSYEAAGGVPAITEVKFSLTANRGCFGGCSFCALTFHQGRYVQTRSQDSLIKEARLMVQDPEFKGYIHDVGGPTANFSHPSCKKQEKYGVCPTKQCLFPKPCKNLETDHKKYVTLLRSLRALPGVKKVFIRSGVRFDYLVYDKENTFLRELCEYHVSGQLKVAPEHISDEVLSRMGKPPAKIYHEFEQKYRMMNEKLGKKQYLVPYLMSSHPGSTLKEAVELAEYIRDMRYFPEQVQDFYPTPSTLSTVMYYTGYDPRTMQKVYTAKSPHEKAMQRALIQYRNPKNYGLVHEALIKAGRGDLIGYEKRCLIRPWKTNGEKKYPSENGKTPKDRKGRVYDGRNAKVRKGKKKKTIRNVHKKH